MEPSIFTKLFIPNQLDNLDIWIAWAVKESVYKLEFQMVQQRYFAPKQIQVLTFDEHLHRGKAKGKFGVYDFEILLEQDFLHAVAWRESSKKPSYHCSVVDCCSLNEHLVSIFQKRFPDKDLQYLNRPFPHFIIDKKISIPVSKSHHGHWCAVAY